MSRFFDALKLADSSLFRSDEIAAERPAAAERSASVERSVTAERADTVERLVAVEQPIPAPAPEVWNTPVAVNGNGTAVAASPELPADPWALSQEPTGRHGRSPANNILFTSLARASVDQNVRVIANAADRGVVEHYRRLRTKIMQQHSVKPFRSLLVTSSAPQEGKSLTVLNLGLSFAMLPSFRVLVVDGDMRRGTLGTWLGVQDRPGLSNLLEGSASLRDIVYTCEDSSIHFMGAGTSKLPSTELLHSSSARECFREIAGQFDLMLMDSPPTALVADAQLLAAQCDAVLLVARAFKTARKGLEKAVHDLVPFRVIGTVLNGGAPARLYRGYGGYY